MMGELRPRDLPDFSRPPVIEVALSVQFEPLVDLRTVHLGLLWERFRDRYPVTQEHPPIANVPERFDKMSEPQQFSLVPMSAPDIRVWFLNEAGSELVQIQRDRFVRNWRGKGDEYPRYEALRDSFAADYQAFLNFLEDEKLGTPKVSQAEVTYVNHIFSGDNWTHHGEAHRVFRVCRMDDASEPEPEDFGFVLRYIIRDNAGNPVGRLHVSVNSAHRAKDQRPLFVMQLTARGNAGSDSVRQFHDLGREWIVRRFAALTTSSMHKIWGRLDDR